MFCVRVPRFQTTPLESMKGGRRVYARYGRSLFRATASTGTCNLMSLKMRSVRTFSQNPQETSSILSCCQWQSKGTKKGIKITFRMALTSPPPLLPLLTHSLTPFPHLLQVSAVVSEKVASEKVALLYTTSILQTPAVCSLPSTMSAR